MRKPPFWIIHTLLSSSIFIPLGHSSTSSELKPESYLEEVRAKNQAILSSQQTAEGIRQRSTESKLMVTPIFFANVQFASDAGLATSFFPREKTISNSYSLGINQATSTGLTARLSYSVNYTSLNGLSPQLSPLLAYTVFHDAKPSLEITQSLWKNGFGSEVRASQEASEAAALAMSHAESFKTKLILAEAEMTYWRLVMARETVAISRENLNRSIKLLDWAQQRLEKQLTDRADVLQAQAALQARKLDLQSALDEEKAASRAFNSARGSEDLTVPERLISLDATRVSSLKAPLRATHREDVLAAEQQSRAARASSRIGMEKNKPTFEVFGSIALNARDSSLKTAISHSWTTERPTLAIGARFSAPLAWNTLENHRLGYAQEEAGAELNYERKLFEENRQWDDLQAKLNEANLRFELSQNLEDAQKEKLMLERTRLSRGRSTTYQVLLFETDYALAQLGRIRAEAEILRIIAQMRTYSGVSS